MARRASSRPSRLLHPHGCVLSARTSASARQGGSCSMLETNLRIVQPGVGLELVVRRARISGPDLTDDLLQRACGHLQHRHGLAAVPASRMGMRAGNGAVELLVLTDRPVPAAKQEGDDWEFEGTDAGLTSVRPRFA